MIQMIYVSWNPSSNAYIAMVADSDGDWTAVKLDGEWSLERSGRGIDDPGVLAELDEAVEDFCARGAN